MLRHYSHALVESGKRPDVVLSSSKADTFVLAELTVSWEDRMGRRNTMKEDRYMDLTMNLKRKGYKVSFFAFEVVARGLVSRSTYTFWREIGLTSKVRSKAKADLPRAAEAASQWIWSKSGSFNSQSCGFVSQPMGEFSTESPVNSVR